VGIVGTAFLIVMLVKNFILNDAEIDGVEIKKKFTLKVEIKDINKKIDDKLLFNNKLCTKIDEKKYTYTCIKPDDGEYSYNFDKYEGNIEIKKEKNTYPIEIDNGNYHIMNNQITLENDILSGKFKLVKDDGSPKYIEKKDISLKIYDSSINHSIIENSYVLYENKWSEFSNVYYGVKKLSIEYSIDNEIYKVSKPYLLTDNLNINEIFSIGQIYNTIENNPKIDDYLKINDKKVIIFNKQNLPNINLITINANNDEELNGFITFTINNIHKDEKMNLFYDGKFIFSIYSLNYMFPNVLDKTFIGGNEKEVNLIDNKLIEKVKISFFKNNDKCKIVATTNNYKPAKSQFDCKEIQTKKNQSHTSINFQINIEKKVCNNDNNSENCVFFEISDIKTGKDERDMY
jgi:hypothetical protein